MPGCSKDFHLERGGFLSGESKIVALRAAADALIRDGAGDGERAGISPADDFEGDRRDSSRARSARSSKRIPMDRDERFVRRLIAVQHDFAVRSL
jgi:hypothetical protein